MKMTPEQAREELFSAMLQAEGNRAKAAEILGMSIRTFYRRSAEYDMYGIFERCGWQERPGARGARVTVNSVIRGIIERHIRAGKGHVDYGRLATELYSADTLAIRTRLFTVLEELKSFGALRDNPDSGVWEVLGK